LDLPKFNSNLHEWISFRDRFVAAVHNTQMQNCDKLAYLKSSLSGDAADVIKAIQVTDDNYNEAWQILTKTYQNLREIGKAHLDRFLEVPAVKIVCIVKKAPKHCQ